jgi:ABC-type nitrate/sulfonate/bicarbonate transport system ATPase subunit
VVLRGVGHTFDGRAGEVHALGPIDLVVEPGEFLAIVGPSGCGKTTLLQVLAGFLKPTAGELTVAGHEVTRPDPTRGMVFQQPNLYPWKSVRQNVALGPRLRGAGRRERNAIADRYIELVGLTEFANAAPYELSGGMQQRAQIARVLANDPRILLLDEPFGALDALTRERLQDELHALWRRSGKTAVFITHSVDEAAYLGSRVLVMSPRPGRIVWDQRTPFGDGERTQALRATPEFVEFRERVREQIAAPTTTTFREERHP